MEPFENFLKNLFNKNKNYKNYHIARDFNLNLLDHHKKEKSPIFFEFNILKWYNTNHNKGTRVTKKTATAIGHIITNNFAENTF